jgi:hypothetical protein
MSLLQTVPLKELKSNFPIGLGGGLLLGTGLHILWKQWNRRKTEQHLKSDRPRRLIVITGCDTGLGFSMAFWAAKLGYKVVAGCLGMESHGGTILRKEFGMKHVFVVQLDVTNPESIQNFVSETEGFLERNSAINLRKYSLSNKIGCNCSS